jgi:hypothetical protein
LFFGCQVVGKPLGKLCKTHGVKDICTFLIQIVGDVSKNAGEIFGGLAAPPVQEVFNLSEETVAHP